MTESFVFEEQRRDLAKVAKKMFDRKMTNVAGGNISQKIVYTIFMFILKKIENI